jgi:hypothetical protein
MGSSRSATVAVAPARDARKRGAEIKDRLFFEDNARRGPSPAAFQFTGFRHASLAALKFETLIPGKALRYHYVNLAGLCATQRKSGIPKPPANGSKNRDAV